ncbi:MAG: tRNA (adenosine(37)-N6)-threonylcarbamoyltransferase complex transferase subunit TsaD [Hyphomonadaceae bacterium]
MQGKAAFGPVLGVETSCDETAAAVVRLRADGGGDILSDVIWTQAEAHAPYAGVVPEIAARAHVEKADVVIAQAMAEAGLSFSALAGVAATAGPGLVGGLMVGLTAGKAIALAHGLPFAAVNHLEGHALSPRLGMASGAATPFPYLLLLASGGHCQFLAVESLGRYARLGSTIDDSAGEAFDKAAKLMGLGYPGGPAIEAAARRGNPARFALPRPLRGRPGCDFSFAGLKTALAQTAQETALTEAAQADLAASFQAAVLDVIVDRAGHALAMYEKRLGDAPRRLVAAGGVAANAALRAALGELAERRGYAFACPPPRYCTDNAAMIALAGAARLAAGLTDPLAAPARPRWPLDEAAAIARPTHASGRKGPKA